jgi:glucose-1-phosphate thymidylyltransferase
MAGIRDIIVVAGYRKEQVMRHLARLSEPMMIVEQTHQLGTGHALLCAKDHITGDFLVLPGDNYIDSASIRNIAKTRNSLLYTTHLQPSNFGVISIEDGIVKIITEKPVHAARMTVSCGIYHFGHELLEKINQNVLSDALNYLIEGGLKLAAVQACAWQDAIYPWDLLSMNERLLAYIKQEKAGVINATAVISGIVSIGRGTKIGPGTVITGPVIIGEDCVIGPHVVIKAGCSIGSRVRIEPFSSINNSILMDDVVIASHTSINSSVIGEGCTVSEFSSAICKNGFIQINEIPIPSSCGVIMGNGVYSGPSVIYENTIIGNDVIIDSRAGIKFSSANIPDKTRVI